MAIAHRYLYTYFRKCDVNYDEFNNMRKVLYRKRRKAFRRPPKTKSRAFKDLKEMADGNDDLVREVNGNVVLIARKEDLQLLSKDKLDLFADGTFKFSPRLFKQVYTLLVFNEGFYVPVAHILLQNKKVATYKKALKTFEKVCKEHNISIRKCLNEKQVTIMIDFESAMIKALKSWSKNLKIQGCKCHLGQSWWRKIK